QVGELDMAGWVYPMEPRGGRSYALAFDDTNSAGSLHLSLFDVSGMEIPVHLDRVNFDWKASADDLDRVHEAFNTLSDEGLILLPYYWRAYVPSEQTCGYEHESGIQLVEMTTESLTLRGVAPQVGSARTALFRDGTLFGIGDNAVQSFDISDRDSPEKLDQLDTALSVASMHLMGSTMLRWSYDWW